MSDWTDLSVWPEPFICPLDGGGFQIEWHVGDRYLEVEFGTDGKFRMLRDVDGEDTVTDEMWTLDGDQFCQWMEWLKGGKMEVNNVLKNIPEGFRGNFQ